MRTRIIVWFVKYAPHKRWTCLVPCNEYTRQIEILQVLVKLNGYTLDEIEIASEYDF